MRKLTIKKKVAFGIAFINPYGMVSAIRYSMNAVFFKFIYSGMVRAYKLLEKDLIVGDLMLWVLRETPLIQFCSPKPRLNSMSINQFRFNLF